VLHVLVKADGIISLQEAVYGLGYEPNKPVPLSLNRWILSLVRLFLCNLKRLCSFLTKTSRAFWVSRKAKVNFLKAKSLLNHCNFSFFAIAFAPPVEFV
jgi:predicted membrane-bound dolichyl-phosphate-mannose-protein mannosyltransferase